MDAGDARSPAGVAWATPWCDKDVVALDGTCLRGASDTREEHKGLYTVNAYGTQAGLVLGQHKVHDKSNEINAIPALLERLQLAGAIVTIDAMGTQSKIAEAIRARGADYVLALKGNPAQHRRHQHGHHPKNLLQCAQTRPHRPLPQTQTPQSSS